MGRHMLTAHEFATLFLAHRAPDEIQPDREDIASLMERHLIEIRADESGARRLVLTPNGLSIVQCMQRHAGRAFGSADA